MYVHYYSTPAYLPNIRTQACTSSTVLLPLPLQMQLPLHPQTTTLTTCTTRKHLGKERGPFELKYQTKKTSSMRKKIKVTDVAQKPLKPHKLSAEERLEITSTVDRKM